MHKFNLDCEQHDEGDQAKAWSQLKDHPTHLIREFKETQLADF